MPDMPGARVGPGAAARSHGLEVRAPALHSAHLGHDLAWISPRVARLCQEGGLGHLEQIEDLLLQLGELGVEDLDRAAIPQQLVPLGVAE